MSKPSQKNDRPNRSNQVKMTAFLDLLAVTDSPELVKAMKEANPDHALFKPVSKKQMRRHTKRSR